MSIQLHAGWGYSSALIKAIIHLQHNTVQQHGPGYWPNHMAQSKSLQDFQCCFDAILCHCTSLKQCNVCGTKSWLITQKNGLYYLGVWSIRTSHTMRFKDVTPIQTLTSLTDREHVHMHMYYAWCGSHCEQQQRPQSFKAEEKAKAVTHHERQEGRICAVTHSCSTQYNLIPGVLQQRTSGARWTTAQTTGEITTGTTNENSQVICCSTRDVFTGSERGSWQRREGHNNGWKEKKRQPCWGLLWPQLPTEDSVSLCSVYTGESTSWSPGRSSSTPSLAIFGLPLASLPVPSQPSVPCHTHAHRHPLTAAPIRQRWVLFLPPPSPGCPSRQESKASLKPERVNEVEERQRERHRPSPTSLLPVLLFARYRLRRHALCADSHTHIRVVL